MALSTSMALTWRDGEDLPHMLGELERTRAAIEARPTREKPRAMLSPGGARNAVDTAIGLHRSDALEQQVRQNRRKEAGNT